MAEQSQPITRVLDISSQQPKEYKVEVITEGALGTIFFGASKLPVRRMTDVLNRYGHHGWAMDFMIVEQKRFLLFWQRESVVITFSRPLRTQQQQEPAR